MTVFIYFYSLQESQSGHHPGHHGHSAPHSSTLPHQIHSGGGNIAHQINLDNSHPHEKHHYHHHQTQSSNKHVKDSHHESHQKSHHTTHHHHHHVSKILTKLKQLEDFFS